MNSNPMFRSNSLFNAYSYDKKMTVNSTMFKTSILLILFMSTAVFSFTHFPMIIFNTKLYIGLGVSGFLLSLITGFFPKMAPFTAPTFAIIEGVFVGTISSYYSTLLDNIIFIAATGTIAIMLSMAFLYWARIINVTQRFVSTLSTVTFGIMIFYLLIWVLQLFGISLPYLHEANPLTLGISILIVIVASLSFLADFHNIEYMVEHNLPKYMEWYGAFSILVTIIWLYLELLRLIRIIVGMVTGK
ncbi:MULTISPECIES: Bax inhibitor-1/YccA family protein [Bacillus cereus group]|uniref:Integral membrane protein n=2 Tax=Bacillus cereus TaxID=1396 RepID=A0A9W5RBD5_BACCE|nr:MULTISPECIES: Bax inhibitor-1/YccA family protein [Bacillus cereus group]AJI08912.1 inhibitor of apoptosis-promoting Bax1 family protein [Bacillus cereus 03BB108]QKG99247.1 Bax inhibitor-1/YccA family protein [Bacillus cereus]HDR7255027.1 Bax inhibitor-1/YccA family protein [Bacillus pacificus]EDX59834.1 conserved hypothetical protein [Bacillus cereus 03BB108]EOQ19603.1 hypothetical protein IKC_04077 [Bacillus cereus VD184]